MQKPFLNKTISVLSGGASQEREISLASGRNVMRALTSLGYKVTHIDPATTDLSIEHMEVAFLALHGPGYEDGTLQSLLEKRHIPYTGCGVECSKLSMDKLKTKRFLNQHSIPTAAFQSLHHAISQLPESFEFPVILKPLSEGSSIDVYIADTSEELYHYSTLLINKYGQYLLETFIDGQELTVSIVEAPVPLIFPILELKPANRFYDFEAKYTKGLTEFILPASLSETESTHVSEIALKVFKKAGCKGMSRIDFRFCKHRGPFVLEFNTVPGLTNTSDLPAQAKAYGWSFERLIDTILSSASLKLDHELD